jgi:hypothetical protein
MISKGVEEEMMAALVPSLLFNTIEVMFVAKAMTRSQGESPILICTVELLVVGGGVWLLVELLLPPHAVMPSAAQSNAIKRKEAKRRSENWGSIADLHAEIVLRPRLVSGPRNRERLAKSVMVAL